MSDRLVTVFGGTGFLGRRAVCRLARRGFQVRIASRRPHRARSLFEHVHPEPQAIAADIHDERSVVEAVAGAFGVINAVSLYVEHGRETFHSVHVEGAERIAAQTRRAGGEHLTHVSGIGSDVTSSSRYIRKRGEGELAARKAFAATTIIRPAVMFGPDDAFLTPILKLLAQLPVYPMFGCGRMKLQPAYVADVAEAVARTMQDGQAPATTYECGGPRVYAYEDLLRTVARHADLKPRLMPLPFFAWHAVARFAELLPSPPITRNQVDLMRADNVASPGMPGFDELGIEPRALEDFLGEMLRSPAPVR